MQQLVNEQLAARSSSNFAKVDMRYARRKNLTPYDVLIIASLVEREAMVAKERPLIASVIYNRLHDGIPLGIDATVRFVTGNWKRAAARSSELAEPEPVQHARARGPAAGADRQPGPGLDQGGRAPGQDEVPLLRGQGGSCGEHRFAKTDAEFQRLRERLQPGARGARGQVAHEVLTTLAGVLGFPVGHSRSPAMMNAAFARARARLALRARCRCRPRASPRRCARCPAPATAAPT